MNIGQFLCVSGLLGGGAVVSLALMLAPDFPVPIAPNGTVLAAVHEGVSGSIVARVADRVREVGKQAQGSEPHTPEPDATAQKLVPMPRHDDLYIELPEIPEPVLTRVDPETPNAAAPGLEQLELPQLPALLVTSEQDGAPESADKEDAKPAPLRQPTAAAGHSNQAFAGEEASLTSERPSPDPFEVAAKAERLSRESEEVGPLPQSGSQGTELISPRSEADEQSSKRRVFIHHASRERDRALLLATKLNEAGFEIAELRTQNNGPSVASVRYFFDEDRAAAIASRASVRSSLSDVRLQNFRDYKPKPRPGTVEVWIPWREKHAKSRARGEMRGPYR